MITERDKAYAQAQRFQQKGQLDRAIAELERLVQDDPADVRTLLKIGDLHVRRQDIPAAIATYTQVAHAYRDDGFSLKAVAVYKQVVYLAPENATIATELAELYEKLGLVSDACQQYRALLEVHRAANDGHAQIRVLQKLFALEGETQDLLLRWAEVHQGVGDLPEVKRTLTRVAEACLAQGRREDWAQVAEDLLAVDPDLTGLACELANHYMAKGAPKQALLKLQVAFRAAPQDTETLTLLAQVFEALGQVPKAIAVLHELGAQAQQRGQALALERIAQHIGRLDPGDARAQGWLTPKGAAKDAAQRLVKRPEPPALSGRAAAPKVVTQVDLTNLLIEAGVFARYGLYQRALEYLDRVLQAFPNHPEAMAQHAAMEAKERAARAAPRPHEGPSLAQPGAEAGQGAMGRPAEAADAPRGDAGRGPSAHRLAPAQQADSAREAPGDAQNPASPEPAPFAFDGPAPPHAMLPGPTTDHTQDGDAAPEFVIELDAEAPVSLDALFDEVIEDGDRTPRAATKLDKHFDDILMARGDGDPAAAPAQHVDASDYDTQFNLGIAYREMGMLEDASVQFGRLFDVPDYRVSARTMQSLCLDALGDRDGARAVLEEALALPDVSVHEQAALHYDLAALFGAAGDAERAQDHLQRVVALDPTFRDARAKLEGRAEA